MSNLGPVDQVRRRTYLLAGVAVLVVLLVLGAVVVTLQLRNGDDDSRERACAEWAELLEQRTVENRDAFGRKMAEQFHREMVASGRIDLGDRVAHRPDGC